MIRGYPPPRRTVPTRREVVREFFRLPPWEGYRLTTRRILNLLLSRYEWLRGKTALSARPIRLTVEPINTCNLRCPACMTGLGQVGRQRSALSLAVYRKVLDELGDYLFEVEFTNWGEPLLCKDLPTMIGDADARGISTTVVTHLSLPFDADRAERLVRSGLTVLGVSIDGARQETYEQYRVRGSLELVLDNCRLILEAKRRLGASRPRIIWSFHTFPHNQDDVDDAAAKASALGMDFAATKGAVLAGEWRSDPDWEFYGNPLPIRCPYLWSFAVLNNDGGVPPCQGAFYASDDMGRVEPGDRNGRSDSFMRVWNNERFREARKLFHTYQPSRRNQDLLCLDCPVTQLYHQLQQHMAQGRSRRTFEVNLSTNDTWRFFVSRGLRPWTPLHSAPQFEHSPTMNAGAGWQT